MNAINSSFIVLCTLLVLLMTPALAMFYSGMVRSKNTLNTIMNCFIVFGVITLQWVVLGFSLSFGKDEGLGLVGNFENFLLEGISGYNASGVPNILFVIFQMMFALIASAIITGSLVGRIKLGVLVIFLLFWSTLVYDVLAHMIWSSEGFLLKRGSLDFAGGGVVHISSGVAGLVGALMVGARKSDDEDKNAHSIPYAFLGAILLFIGWLGFNAGSAGEMNDIAINAFIVSIISAACGFLSWVTYPRTALLLTFLLRLSLHDPLLIPFRVQLLCFFQRNGTFSSRLLVQRSKVYLTARYAGFYVLQRVTVL